MISLQKSLGFQSFMATNYIGPILAPFRIFAQHFSYRTTHSHIGISREHQMAYFMSLVSTVWPWQKDRLLLLALWYCTLEHVPTPTLYWILGTPKSKFLTSYCFQWFLLVSVLSYFCPIGHSCSRHSKNNMKRMEFEYWIWVL